ncbi:MAG: AAA family ATPase [Demequinaceae bacterium]|nr:AAA family ATPase [Demequinaceae bacterium]
MSQAAPTNPSVAQLAQAVLVAPPRCGRTRVVLIDGPAGSGKTTLAERLGHKLGAQVLHADDMYEGWDGLPVLWDILGARIIEPLSRGENAGFERWDWVASARAEHIAVPAADALVIEGVGVAQRAARPFASLVIYVDAPWPERLSRGVARDGEAMRAQWEVWQYAEEEFLNAEDTSQAADLAVDGTLAVPDAW